MRLEDSGGQLVVLVALDLIGVDRALAQAICESLRQSYGLERCRISLCVSHTHSGPVVGRGLEALHYRQLDREQQTGIDAYAEELQRRVVDCVGRALADRSACEVAWGSGTATFAVNRRNNPEPKVPELRAERSVIGTRGPRRSGARCAAPRMGRGKRSGSGTPAMPRRSATIPGAVITLATRRKSWSNDIPAVWRCSGRDVVPIRIPCRAGVWSSPNSMVASWPQQWTRCCPAPPDWWRLPAHLRTAWTELLLPLSTGPSLEELHLAVQSEDRYVRARAAMYLERLAAGQAIPTSVPYPVQLWELGDTVQFIGLGGEVVVDYALRLKAELRGKQTWVAGYANDVMAYIPSQRVLAEGGYEGKDAMVYYGLPSPWTAQVEPLIVESVHALADSVQGKDAIQSGEAVGGGAGENGQVRQGVRLP